VHGDDRSPGGAHHVAVDAKSPLVDEVGDAGHAVSSASAIFLMLLPEELLC
jgi:hypothetical protein